MGKLLEVKHLKKYFKTASGLLHAVDDVSFSVPEGETLGFYTAKMPPREAAAWLTGYPRGQYLPGGQGWKRVKKA